VKYVRSVKTGKNVERLGQVVLYWKTDEEKGIQGKTMTHPWRRFLTLRRSWPRGFGFSWLVVRFQPFGAALFGLAAWKRV